MMFMRGPWIESVMGSKIFLQSSFFGLRSSVGAANAELASRADTRQAPVAENADLTIFEAGETYQNEYKSDVQIERDGEKE